MGTPYRITVEQFNIASNVITKNSVDVVVDDGTTFEDFYDTWLLVFLPKIRACHTGFTTFRQIFAEQLVYDATSAPLAWSVGNLVYVDNPNVTGTRVTPTGDKLPYGVGHYIKTTDATSRRPGKLILKTDTYEADVVPQGTYWRASGGTLGTPLADLAAHFCSLLGLTNGFYCNVHKGIASPGKIEGATYMWTQKYRYPRPVLL